MNILGPFLREQRLNRKLNQAQVCERLADCGVRLDRTMLSRIERKERMLTDIELVALMEVLGIPPAAIRDYLSSTEAPHAANTPDSSEREGGDCSA
jgi:transcriptional regulator with XRE-family HTH domain